MQSIFSMTIWIVLLYILLFIMHSAGLLKG